MTDNGLKSHRLILSVIMLAIVVSGIAYGVHLLRNPGPFSGDVRHDFGIIPIDGLKGSAEYSFELVNEADHTIYIESVRASCGCTAVETSTQYVEPGETVYVTARLTVNRSGVKESHLRMLLADDGTQTLYVKGNGRRNNPLSSLHERVSIEPNGEATIRLSAEVYEARDAPPTPNAEVPADFEVVIGKWQRKGSRDAAKKTPDRYSTNVTVRHTGDAIPEGEALVLSMVDEYGQTVTLTLPIVLRTEADNRGKSIEIPTNDRG